MIDNDEKTGALLQAMEANLPIPVLPTKEVLKLIRQSNVPLPKSHHLQIEKVHYLGDVGGISCGITLAEGSKEAFITSVTHLHLHPGVCLTNLA